MLKTETLKRKSCNENEIKKSSGQQALQEREPYSLLPSYVSSSSGAPAHKPSVSK